MLILQEEIGTTLIMIELPNGTFSTKPVPAYGFNVSIATRVLDPPQGLWGEKSNTTVDTITWKAVDDFVLPNWAVGFFRMSVSLCISPISPPVAFSPTSSRMRAPVCPRLSPVRLPLSIVP